MEPKRLLAESPEYLTAVQVQRQRDGTAATELTIRRVDPASEGDGSAEDKLVDCSTSS